MKSRWRKAAGLLVAFPAVGIFLFALSLVGTDAGPARASQQPLRVELILSSTDENLAGADPLQFASVQGVDLGRFERGLQVNIVQPPPDDAALLLNESPPPTNNQFPPPPPKPVPLKDWAPNPNEANKLQQIRSAVAEETKDLAQRGTKLREGIIRMEVDSAGKDFKLNSDGGVEGAIRLLNVEGFPPGKIQPILDQYGISFERRHTKPTAGRGFLNSAATARGTFRNVDVEGDYEVMVLSARAVAFMSTLETEALFKRDYDPAKTRIRKIIFGIVDNGDGKLDLGVTDLQVEQIH